MPPRGRRAGPQITARAGLTTRTFFRHFADKREVLFAGEELVPERVARLMAEAPPSLGPMELITEGLAPTAAEIAVTTFRTAVTRWRNQHGEPDLPATVNQTLAAMRHLTNTPST